MKKAIPPELHAWCIAEANRGQTSEQIAEALWRQHKVEVTGRSVRKLLQKHRSELADVAKGLIRERLRSSSTPDLDSLEQLHESAINAGAARAEIWPRSCAPTSSSIRSR
jgi:hypothetical protein